MCANYIVFPILATYNMRKEQIFTITCDNASNMVKLSKIINMNDECGAEAPHIEKDLSNFVDSKDNESDDEYAIEDGTLLSTNDVVNQLFNEEVNDHTWFFKQNSTFYLFFSLCNLNNNILKI